MKLYSSLTSPYGRKARVVLAEKKIPYTLEIVNPWADDSPVPALNPLGKVPVLVLEDGASVFDSRVIVEYLDHISPVGHLIPAEPKARMVVRGVEALADGLIDAAVAAYLENKRAPDKRDSAWSDMQSATMQRALRALDNALGEKPWYLGITPTLADIATGCALGYLDLRFPELDWRRSQPGLAQLMTRLSGRTSFSETQPPRV